MRTGDNYSGARWAHAGGRPRRLYRRCVRCKNLRRLDRYIGSGGRICDRCREAPTT